MPSPMSGQDDGVAWLQFSSKVSYVSTRMLMAQTAVLKVLQFWPKGMDVLMQCMDN